MQTKSRLKASSVSHLLATCVTAEVAGAIDEVKRRLPTTPPKQKSRRAIAMTAAGLLLVHGNHDDWPRLWKLVQADPAFGRNLFERFAYEHHYVTPPILDQISPKEFVLLWEWMLRQYPVAEDPDRSRGAPLRLAGKLPSCATTSFGIWLNEEPKKPATKSDGYRSRIRSLNGFHGCSREGSIRLGETRGSQQHRVNYSSSRQTGTNVSVQMVINCSMLCAMPSKDHSREAARGNAGRAIPLGWRPAKEEEAVSDWVKIELDNLLTTRGIVINREVQIHIGERTDVHVDAISREAPTADFTREKVIIEVKGYWNPDQKTAMKQQLVEQYLRNNDCIRGIFLLAWFVCDLWTRSDARKRKVPFSNACFGRALFREASGTTFHTSD